MKSRFRLITRGCRGDAYYCVDNLTRKRTSLGTADRDAAEQIVQARNQSLCQPSLNLQIARAYLAGSDPGVAERTWAMALEALIQTKRGSTRERWIRAGRDKALVALLPKVIIESRAEDLLAVVARGEVSTNIQLRKRHNLCVAMTWLSWPLVPRPQCPPIKFKERRAVTAEEHERIVE